MLKIMVTNAFHAFRLYLFAEPGRKEIDQLVLMVQPLIRRSESSESAIIFALQNAVGKHLPVTTKVRNYCKNCFYPTETNSCRYFPPNRYPIFQEFDATRGPCCFEGLSDGGLIYAVAILT